jgi:hypothetical protein
VQQFSALTVSKSDQLLANCTPDDGARARGRRRVSGSVESGWLFAGTGLYCAVRNEHPTFLLGSFGFPAQL